MLRLAAIFSGPNCHIELDSSQIRNYSEKHNNKVNQQQFSTSALPNTTFLAAEIRNKQDIRQLQEHCTIFDYQNLFMFYYSCLKMFDNKTKFGQRKLPWIFYNF